MKTLMCVAHGRKEQWEALCLDFDLAVQGRSFNEVKERLEKIIASYIEDALAEAEPTRSQLLNRRAPFLVRLTWGLRFLWATITAKTDDGDTPVGFPVSCPA